MSEPTLPELMRRLDASVQSQERLVSRIDVMLGDVAKIYATKESTADALALRDLRIKALEDDNKDAAGFRRQVAAGFIVGFLLLLVPLLGTITRAIGAS